MALEKNPHDTRSPEVFINLKVRGLGTSATLSINEHSNRLIREGKQVFKLGLGQSPFPVPEHVVQALADHAHEKDYLPVKGLMPLREAVVKWAKRTEGIAYSPDNVLIGPGTKELMFLAQLVYYGDLVIPSPSWVSYAPQAHIVGRPIKWLHTEIETGLGITPEGLDEFCSDDPIRPRLVVLNSPGNPTGIAYSGEQLAELAEVFRKYRILVISDEIYSGLNFRGEHQSLARYYPEGAIISNGLSKWCGAGGWRLGWFVFPDSLSWLANSMAAVASETYTSICAPVQYAAITALEDRPDMDDYLSSSRQVLSALSAFAVNRLESVGARVTEASGGFYLFPCFNVHKEALNRRGIHNNRQLCETMLEETGVAALPGSVFGRPEQEMSMRIALVAFDGRQALMAAKTEGIDEGFLQRHCADLVEAIERMVRFFDPGVVGK